jgi:hypothetical protein
MTDPSDAFADLTRQGHQVFAAAVQAWQQAARSMAEAAGRPGAQVPDVAASVDAAFDFAAQMLADQRDFTRTLMSAGADALAAAQPPTAGADTETPAAPEPAAAPAAEAAPAETPTPAKKTAAPRKAAAKKTTARKATADTAAETAAAPAAKKTTAKKTAAAKTTATKATTTPRATSRTTKRSANGATP